MKYTIIIGALLTASVAHAGALSEECLTVLRDSPLVSAMNSTEPGTPERVAAIAAIGQANMTALTYATTKTQIDAAVKRIGDAKLAAQCIAKYNHYLPD
jgi:hypothetical protein